MGRATLLAGTVVLLGTLAACGGEPEGVGFGGAPPPVASATAPVPAPVPDGPVPPPGGTPVPGERVDASGLPDGHPRLVWTRDGGTVLGLYGQEGGCSSVSAEIVTQTPERVTVRLVEVIPTTGPCTMDLRFPPLTVPLAEPLGDRAVVLERRSIGPPPG